MDISINSTKFWAFAALKLIILSARLLQVQFVQQIVKLAKKLGGETELLHQSPREMDDWTHMGCAIAVHIGLAAPGGFLESGQHRTVTMQEIHILIRLRLGRSGQWIRLTLAHRGRKFQKIGH